MKMIIALNNKYIEDKIKDLYCDSLDVYILKTKEDVLSYINSNDDFIIITRDSLKGEIDFLEYLFTIKEKNVKNKVVVILKELKKEVKEKLFSKEIFNIIIGDTICFDEIIENIESPKMIVYKNKEIKNNIIFVTGLRKSGKTIICKILSEEIVKNTDRKVIVIDLDLIYPSLDLYIRGSKNYSLNILINDIKSNQIKEISNYLSDDYEHDNLKYILNSKTLPLINGDTIKDLILYLKRYYDYVIIDTSTIMINTIYNVVKEVKAECIFCVKILKDTIREFNIETKFIDNNLIRKSKFVINEFDGKKAVLKLFEKNMKINIYATVRKSTFIDKYILTNKKIYIRYDFKRLLKSIGVVRFQNLRNRIINKLIKIEEE